MKVTQHLMSKVGLVSAISIILHGGLVATAQADVQPAQVLKTLEFRGDIIEDEDISAISLYKDFLVIGTDEGATIQALSNEGGDVFSANALNNILLDMVEDSEIDIEGMESSGDYLYVVGSHSGKRKKVKGKKTVAENRERLATTEFSRTTKQIFRVSLDNQGEAVEITGRRFINRLIRHNPILRPFKNIPSKENGIDIEAIAVDEQEQLYLGFRSPVLRGNWVPVLVTEFGDWEGDLRFINLDGRGIRGMSRMDNSGFLVIGGPPSDSTALSYQLYFWDGIDDLSGSDKGDVNHVTPLCEIPIADGAKAEGVQFLDEANGSITATIVFDSATNGSPTVIKCPFNRS